MAQVQLPSNYGAQPQIPNPMANYQRRIENKRAQRVEERQIEAAGRDEEDRQRQIVKDVLIAGEDAIKSGDYEAMRSVSIELAPDSDPMPEQTFNNIHEAWKKANPVDSDGYSTTPHEGINPKTNKPGIYLTHPTDKVKWLDVGPKKGADSKPSAYQESIAGLEGVVNREANGKLPPDVVKTIAAKLAESGSVVAIDPSGNAIVDKVKFEVLQALGEDPSGALTNIVNPREERIRVLEGTRDLAKDMEEEGLPDLDRQLSDIETIFRKGGVKGFSMVESTIGALTNDSLNQLFFGDEANENRQRLSAVANALIKSRAGMAQTLSEERRVINEMGRGVFRSEEDVRIGLEGVRGAYEAAMNHILLSYDQDIIKEWRNRQLPSLSELVDLDEEW